LAYVSGKGADKQDEQSILRSGGAGAGALRGPSLVLRRGDIASRFFTYLLALLARKGDGSFCAVVSFLLKMSRTPLKYSTEPERCAPDVFGDGLGRKSCRRTPISDLPWVFRSLRSLDLYTDWEENPR
jgi:hypothetical protein